MSAFLPPLAIQSLPGVGLLERDSPVYYTGRLYVCMWMILISCCQLKVLKWYSYSDYLLLTHDWSTFLLIKNQVII